MEMTAQNTTIKPSYKQTEVGVIPEDWKLKSFRDVCRVNQGLQIAIENRLKNPTKKSKIYITIQYLNDGKEVEYIDNYTFSVCCDKDDILMTRTGNTGVVVSGVEGVFHNNFFKINYDKDIIDKDFLVYYLNMKRTQNIILTKAGTSTIPDLNHNDFYSIPIPLPTKAEQTTIATVLSDTDALITSLDRLIVKKRDIKQATMQQLLTGKTRLPGFSGEWEVKKLGEVGKPYGGLSGKSKVNFVDGQYPYIPFLNIMKNPVIDITYFDYVSIDYDESQNKVIKGDLLFNGSSETPEEVGMCSMLNEDIPNLYLNSFCFGFRLNKELKTNGLYLSYYFRSSIGRQLLYSLAQGATRYNLSKSNFLKLEIPYPGPDEQRAISTILSDMDAEIAALEQKRDKTRALKQGMMQELLTGKTRLV